MGDVDRQHAETRPLLKAMVKAELKARSGQ
jgi:hypothetical protein